MKFTATIASIASLVALVSAGGSIDNSADANRIASSASTLNGAGNYVLTNVATGQTLAFSRSGVTNFFPQDGGDPVSIQFSGNQARISGGNNKCASAQWDANFQGGVDYAAVAYACKVGSGPLTGTASLESTKQWWYLMPAGEQQSSKPAPAPAPAPEPTAAPSSAAPEQPQAASTPEPAPQLNAAAAKPSSSSASEAAPATEKAWTPPASSSSSSSSSSAASSSAESSSSSSSSSSAPPSEVFTGGTTAAQDARAQFHAEALQAKAAVAPSSGSDTGTTWNPAGYWESASSSINMQGVDESNVNPQDRTTWVCRHPGWWLANHPEYVTSGGHVECANDLKAYLASHQGKMRMGKRSVAVAPSHKDLAQRLAKKAGQPSYYIIAVDHIHDMATRAIGSNSISTFGGYTSTSLDYWQEGNDGQMWTITSA